MTEMKEAAIEISRLQSENAELRRTLEFFGYSKEVIEARLKLALRDDAEKGKRDEAISDRKKLERESR